MKRWIALLMAIMLALTVFGASADQQYTEVTGPRGPELPSSFEVVEEEGLSQSDTTQSHTEVAIGTDVYLFVDPATASYVTFYVYDEWGQPLPNATIEISYNGVQALYGVTDDNGLCSMYLFRNVEYEYHVNCYHYEHDGGFIIPTDATKLVEIRLRRHHDFIVIIEKNGIPQPNVTIWIDGRLCVTDEHGRVTTWVYTGDHLVKVKLSNGKYIYRRVYVDWDMFVVIDLADYVMDSTEPYSRNFLVYDKLYQPEDYVITYFDHSEKDLPRENDETEEAFRERAQAYLAQYPAAIAVEAMPERKQLSPGFDRNEKHPDGTLLYAQRSMMPEGALLRRWEQAGYQQVTFTNEHFNLRFALADLHSPAMTKAFALADELDGYGTVSAALSREAEMPDSIEDAALIDWSAVRPFAFAFDHETRAEGVELLPESVFGEALFEFRITPVTPEEIEALHSLPEQETADETVIRTESEAWLAQHVRQQKMDGLLLAAEEQALQGANVDGKMYRVSCWIILGSVKMDVTSLLESLEVLWLADELDQPAPEEMQNRTFGVMDAALEPAEKPVQVWRTRSDAAEPFASIVHCASWNRTDVDVRLIEEEYRAYEEDGCAAYPDHTYLMMKNPLSALVWLNGEE